MNSKHTQTSSRAISNWLLIGVLMILVQVILGGITRLTESGLSITEWKPITGALPPMNETAWQLEFAKYQHTDQFRYIHADFSLKDFKLIFFWEWFHRLWGRLLGVVFIAGFVYFLAKRKLQRDMVAPLVILFLLGAMQAIIGWLMVKSGLVPEKMFVGHIELTTHFIAAMVLLCYTLWFALRLRIPPADLLVDKPLKNLTVTILTFLFIQLIYGAFMAGLKAATAAPTWPDINGAAIPDAINQLTPWWKNLIDNKIMVQFVHRTMAYVLVFLSIIWYIRARKIIGNALLNKTRWLPLGIIIFQLILGICTVLRSPYGNDLVYLGVAHQLTGLLFLMVMVWMIYLIRYPKGSA